VVKHLPSKLEAQVQTTIPQKTKRKKLIVIKIIYLKRVNKNIASFCIKSDFSQVKTNN
jgi:hypothetical protein